jgi:hypothetical protein
VSKRKLILSPLKNNENSQTQNENIDIHKICKSFHRILNDLFSEYSERKNSEKVFLEKISEDIIGSAST